MKFMALLSDTGTTAESDFFDQEQRFGLCPGLAAQRQCQPCFVVGQTANTGQQLGMTIGTDFTDASVVEKAVQTLNCVTDIQVGRLAEKVIHQTMLWDQSNDRNDKSYQDNYHL